MSLADEKYALVVTFTRDGTPKPTAIWPVDAGDGRIGFVTTDDTWKVKRLRNTSRVTIQPSNSRGVVSEGTSPVEGTGEIVYGAEFEAVKRAVHDKYGWQMTAISMFGRLRDRFSKKPSGDDCAVIITLDPAVDAAD